LDGVHELVAQQLAALARLPATLGEHHMPSDGERVGVNRIRRARGGPVGVYPHSAQILADP
jgi:hypothetical protein